MIFPSFIFYYPIGYIHGRQVHVCIHVTLSARHKEQFDSMRNLKENKNIPKKSLWYNLCQTIKDTMNSSQKKWWAQNICCEWHRIGEDMRCMCVFRQWGPFVELWASLSSTCLYLSVTEIKMNCHVSFKREILQPLSQYRLWPFNLCYQFTQCLLCGSWLTWKS